MVGDGTLGSAHVVPLTAQVGQRLLYAQQVGCGSGAERDNHLRLHDVDLLQEKLRAGVRFDGFRHAVLRWPAFHDVGDVHRLAGQAHGADHVVQQLTCFSDKGQTGRILIRPWTLAHKHQVSPGIAVREHDGVAAGIGQRAAGTVTDVFPQRQQRGRFGRRRKWNRRQWS